MTNPTGPRFWLVDAFAHGPFTGNPAVVMPLTSWPDDDWLQRVAREMNQAETAFLVREGNGFRLRWFAPAVEVALCGHATLASAHVLWQEGLVPRTEAIAFATRSGTLIASRSQEDDQAEIQLDFPLEPAQPVEAPLGLYESLGVAPAAVWKNRFDYLVELASESEVRALRPDFTRLRAIPCRGVIVTAQASTTPYDFVARFFCPTVGVDEDPATGSAYCCLGDYWQPRLGKSEFLAYQASQRGGVIGVRVTTDRALLKGRAWTIAQGALSQPAE